MTADFGGYPVVVCKALKPFSVGEIVPALYRLSLCNATDAIATGARGLCSWVAVDFELLRIPGDIRRHAHQRVVRDHNVIADDSIPTQEREGFDHTAAGDHSPAKKHVIF